MLKLHGQGIPIDVVTVGDAVKEAGKDGDGLLADLGDLAKNTPSAANVAHYARVVRNRATDRELEAAGHQIIRSVSEPGSTADRLNDAQASLMAITEERQTGSGPRLVREILPASADALDDRYNRRGAIVGLPTGLIDLDRMTAGFQPGDLIVVAARPSMGKTAIATTIAQHAAIHDRKSVLIFSLEMKGEQLVDRFISSIGEVDFDRIRTGQVDGEDWSRVTVSMAALSDSALSIGDTRALTVAAVRSRSRQVKRKQGLDLVVIDYLGLMRATAENRTQEIASICGGLKTLAGELDVPVIVLSQLNRNVEGRPDKRPVLSDLRDSGAIEQDADVIAFLYRDDYYNPESRDRGFAELGDREAAQWSNWAHLAAIPGSVCPLCFEHFTGGSLPMNVERNGLQRNEYRF